MTKTREERMQHLNLSESCIEIGGYDSREYRGLLAHYLKTTIPTHVNKEKRYACLCHACNNHKCSNPKHLYWGSYTDNIEDRYGSLPYSPKSRRIRKTRIDHSTKIDVRSDTPLSEEELNYYRQIFLNVNTQKYGWISKVSKELNISHTHVRRIANRLNISTYKRNG
jgi:hypothetical protein